MKPLIYVADTHLTTDDPEVDSFVQFLRRVGSTAGTASSVGNLIQCVAVATAPDAAFRIDVPYTTTLTVDFSDSGTFDGSVMGLFKGGIGPQGYIDAGNICRAKTAGPPQFSAPVTPGTYYVVLTGTSASGPASGGNYDITFTGLTTDPAAFTLENDTLAQAGVGDLCARKMDDAQVL